MGVGDVSKRILLGRELRSGQGGSVSMLSFVGERLQYTSEADGVCLGRPGR